MLTLKLQNADWKTVRPVGALQKVKEVRCIELSDQVMTLSLLLNLSVPLKTDYTPWFASTHLRCSKAVKSTQSADNTTPAYCTSLPCDACRFSIQKPGDFKFSLDL